LPSPVKGRGKYSEKIANIFDGNFGVYLEFNVWNLAF
jgi:hypothetical protein